MKLYIFSPLEHKGEPEQGLEGGEEGQPQQFLVRAIFSSISRPSHLEILVLSILFFLNFLILPDKTIF